MNTKNNKTTLPLSDSLREARSIPVFNGEDDYTLSNFLRDINIILDLTAENDQIIIQKVLGNRIQGKALQVIQTLNNVSWDEGMAKLKEEFGVRESFINLRNKAMNVKASNIDELYKNLKNVLNAMNSKFSLEGGIHVLYTPSNNENLIFDIYVDFLPFNIKVLLIQNEIKTIDKAFRYLSEHNLLKDIKLRNHLPNNQRQCSNDLSTSQGQLNRNTYQNHRNGNNSYAQIQNPRFPNNNYYKNHTNANFQTNSDRNNFQYRPNNYNTNNPFSNNRQYNNSNRHHNNNQNNLPYNNNSGQFRQNSQDIKSMEAHHTDVAHNFLFATNNSLPLVDLSFGGVIIRCLIDSGSSTVIGDSGVFITHFPYKVKMSKPIMVNTLLGTYAIHEEVIIKVPLDFEANDEMSVKLMDLKGRSFKCIIGVNILSALGCCIDFSNNSLFLKYKNKVIPFVMSNKENTVADFLSRGTQSASNNQSVDSTNQHENDFVAVNLQSLFNNSIQEINNGNEERLIEANTIVNKYNMQIRLLHHRDECFKILYNRYKIIFLNENDLHKNSYVNDLLRLHISKGTVGVYSELNNEKYKILENKILQLLPNDKVKIVKCSKLAVDIQSKDELLEIIEKTHIESNHRGILENLEKIKSDYFFPRLQ